MTPQATAIFLIKKHSESITDKVGKEDRHKLSITNAKEEAEEELKNTNKHDFNVSLRWKEVIKILNRIQ